MQVQSFLHNHQLNRLISPLLGLGVSITLGIYLVQQIDFAHFFVLAKNVPVWLFFLLLALCLLLNVFRALRFRVLLGEKPFPLAILFPITLCHNFFVRTLPLMVGEFSYALLRRYLKVPVSEGIRSLFEARFFDLQFVLLSGAFGLLAMEHQSTGYVLSALVLMALLIPGNRVFFPLLSKGVEQDWGYIVQIGSWRHTALRDTISGKLGEISYQLDRFRCLRYLLKVLICSFCTYSINLSFHLLLLTTLNVDQRLNVWLVVIPIVMIASWFPFSLSGFGIVEGSWAGSLVLFANMTIGPALSIGFFIHCCQVLMITLLGGFGFFLLRIRTHVKPQTDANQAKKTGAQSIVLASNGEGKCQ